MTHKYFDLGGPIIKSMTAISKYMAHYKTQTFPTMGPNIMPFKAMLKTDAVAPPVLNSKSVVPVLLIVLDP